MRGMTMLIGALAMLGAGCSKKKEEAKTEAPATTAAQVPAPTPTPEPTPPPTPPAPAAKKLYMDVHELGKVTAKDVAGAHQKDLAVQGKHDVAFKAYWVDEKNGKVYCLSESPSPEATTAAHKEAHGLLPAKIMEVSADAADWTPTAGSKLFMDVHNLGAGKVTPEAVADAHKKDLAVQDKHKVKFINYWLDQESGTVLCLSEAPNAKATIAAHKAAHGLIPDSIEEVTEGR